MDYIYKPCPHCGKYVLIHKNEINCAIFRHGTYKADGTQINPHEKKEVCDALARDGLIYGCGKPFKVEARGTDFALVVCDYI